MTLAVKYRPKTFNDVVGQDHIINVLKKQIELNKSKNAYLFTGASGCGKTTCARIFAELLNEGKLGITEKDVASNNYKENILEIIEDCNKKPLFSKYKIYILDEAHLFSSNGWSSLLKLLEEPPEYVKIILCTTEPQKIFHTIFSRVQRFDFKTIDKANIANRLECIIEQEYKDVWYCLDTLNYLSELSNGCMREAISLLEKCLDYSSGLDFKNIDYILNKVSKEDLHKLLTAIHTGKSDDIIKIFDKIDKSGIDIKEVVRSLITLLIEMIGDYNADFMQLLDNLLELQANIKWENNSKDLVLGKFLVWSKYDRTK